MVQSSAFTKDGDFQLLYLILSVAFIVLSILTRMKDLAKALQFLTDEELNECKCTVTDEKARIAPGLKGLQIKVIMNFHLGSRRATLLRKKIHKVDSLSCKLL